MTCPNKGMTIMMRQFQESNKRRETYVNDDHLDVADDENAVLVGLRDVDVAICNSNGSSPAAVDALGAANVVLHAKRKI